MRVPEFPPERIEGSGSVRAMLTQDGKEIVTHIGHNPRSISGEEIVVTMIPITELSPSQRAALVG